MCLFVFFFFILFTRSEASTRDKKNLLRQKTQIWTTTTMMMTTKTTWFSLFLDFKRLCMCTFFLTFSLLYFTYCWLVVWFRLILTSEKNNFNNFVSQIRFSINFSTKKKTRKKIPINVCIVLRDVQPNVKKDGWQYNFFSLLLLLFFMSKMDGVVQKQTKQKIKKK